MGEPHQAVLVAEAALGTDQGQKYLYVVDQAGKAERRDVKVGQIHDGLRVILDGLATSDQVVVSGLQRVRNGVTVKPNLIAMPGTEPDDKGLESGNQTAAGNGKHREARRKE